VATSTEEALTLLAERGSTEVYVDGGKVIQDWLRRGLIDDIVLTRAPILALPARKEGPGHRSRTNPRTGQGPGVDAGRPLGPVGAQSKVPQVGVGGRHRHPGVVHHGPLGERARQLQNLCPNGVAHTSAPKGHVNK